MNRGQVRALFPDSSVYQTDLSLIAYCKTIVKILGFIEVYVQCNKTRKKLNIYITELEKEPLLGREWIRQLKCQRGVPDFLGCNALESYNINAQETTSQLQFILQQYKDLGAPTLAKITGIQARLTRKPNVTPVFLKARAVPFRLIPLLERELSELEQAGILTKVENSEWATPIVPLEIHSDDRKFLTLNTHKGLFAVNRLMYGIASAPAIWQRTLEQILQDIPGVAIFLDDIVVTAPSDDEHLRRLHLVLNKLLKHNVRINLEKSTFFKNEIQYCGHVLRKDGIHKEPSKMEAIRQMPRPRNISDVRAFVGMINYYNKFIRNLSSILQPLNILLHKNTRFIWGEVQEKAFRKAKEAFMSNRILTHFDPKLPIVLATDASPYGVGAVLSHTYPDGTERVIQFASQTLSETQQKYAQIDKEAYSIIFGIKKFYQYLYGGKFTLVTDHRPLVQIFSPNQSLPVYSAMRMQHYAIFLQGFNYTIRYRKSESHANADCLSRLPLKEGTKNIDVVDAFELNLVEDLPVNAKRIESETKKDTQLQRLLVALQSGSQAHSADRFNLEQSEFTLRKGIILRGHRVVIPKVLRARILKEVHTGHFGINKMKGIARNYCWWSEMDKDIKELVDNCRACNSFKNNPPKIEQHIWEPSAAPMHRVHADFAGPFLGQWFFIVVDAFSKWPEVRIVKNITAKTIIDECREIFASYGVPQCFITDNGRTFTSAEFKAFLGRNGVNFKYTAPYNPATNGQAERFVQTLKNALRRMDANTANVHEKLCKMLLQYRSAPHATTNKSPAELFLGRHVNQMRSIGQATPKQDEDSDYGSVEDVIVGTNMNASEEEVNGREQPEKAPPEVSHHPPELPQPQQTEIVPQSSNSPPKNIGKQGARRKPRKIVADITRKSDRIAAKMKPT
ncbi:PREDICTED: uncharacterized protein K02A2.6-like [Vollenhovia emeryi]|uniref:uncharacterized protein K02A2.6-like n=1 Tax=Vollenhovia emeryi TaxID=411798 RepID=UPI0005F567A3|nr:PREDICTED: uncharacterized protein K02A2.6-like [Vollenhovia emeryi]